MYRKIYEELLEWKKNGKKPLMLLGVRQCGKTYIIEEFCRNEYKDYVNINLLRNTEVVNIYKTNMNSDEKFDRLKAYIGENVNIEDKETIIFIDEIQISEEIISELKYFCEEHNNINIICAGSLLGVALNRFNSSFPVGKVEMIDMFPMDFEEFLIAMNENMLINLIYECYEKNTQMSAPLHQKAMILYTTYLITGGMPESVFDMINVKKDYVKYNKKIIKNIVNSYFKDMSKHVINKTETLKIKALYNSLASQLSNPSNKFQFSKIEEGAKYREYALPLDWLESSNMVVKTNLVKLPEIPLEGFKDNDTFKLYLSDVGILNYLLKISMNDILMDNISLYKGVIAENYVANQLTSLGYNLYYWQSDNQAEVDFLLYTKDGVIPMEVKAGDNTQSKSLKVYIEKYKPKYSIRVSSKDFGYDPKTKIKSIPLYAIFCLKNEKGL